MTVATGAPIGRRKKYAETIRREIAKRYREYLHNSPRVLCAEYGINTKTLRAYTREFRG
jgi:hypothetical protein